CPLPSPPALSGSGAMWPNCQLSGFHLWTPPSRVPTQTTPPRSWARARTWSSARLDGMRGSWREGGDVRRGGCKRTGAALAPPPRPSVAVLQDGPHLIVGEAVRPLRVVAEALEPSRGRVEARDTAARRAHPQRARVVLAEHADLCVAGARRRGEARDMLEAPASRLQAVESPVGAHPQPVPPVHLECVDPVVGEAPRLAVVVGEPRDRAFRH